MAVNGCFKFKPFSDKQLKVLTWWNAKSPVHDKEGIIADGAIRSGKTICMSLSYVMWAMYNFDNNNFGMCGKTIGSFRRNVVFWLKMMLNSRGYKVHDARSDNMLTIEYKGKINYFYIFGGKDERSQDLIQGITLAGCFFDEVVLMPESFVNQATGRCSIDGSKIWFNDNPEGPFHWFKINWIDCVDKKNLLYLHFTMDDNLSLSDRIKSRYKSMYTGVFYQRYIEGLWSVAEGIIYDMFDEHKHVVKLERIEGLLDSGRYVSCDYGTQNATTFLLWNKDIKGKWHCIREYYYSGRSTGKQKTDAEYADDLVDWLDKTKIKSIIVDPAAASFIAELRKRNYTVEKAKNDVLDGIRFTAMLINTDSIDFDESCTNTIKEFHTYAWDSKAADAGEDKPIKVNDHCMDAVRYFCYTVIANGRKAKIHSSSRGIF